MRLKLFEGGYKQWANILLYVFSIVYFLQIFKVIFVCLHVDMLCCGSQGRKSNGS